MADIESNRPSHGQDSTVLHSGIPTTGIDEERKTRQYQALIQLPAAKYQHTVWHELKNTGVKGDELRAPRIREGPENKLEIFYSVDDEGIRIHHDKKGKELVIHRDKQENWEQALHANLSSQLLSDKYQTSNFTRILKRLQSAEEVILMDNALQDLKGVTFPRCRILNLSNNLITSFKDLPKTSNLRNLILSHNQIGNSNGLGRYQQLETLDLSGNPICYTIGYRQRVFKVLPNLKVLDETLKLPSDVINTGYAIRSQPPTGCTII